MSVTTHLRIETRDPIIARDGRPFTAGGGNRMYCLPWLLPGTLCGAIRSRIGYQFPSKFSKENVQRLQEISIKGPLPAVADQLFFPAPLDAVQLEDKSLTARRPWQRESESSSFADLPESLTLAVINKGHQPAKYSDIAPWWSLQQFEQWLQSPSPNTISTNELQHSFLKSPPKQRRTHVKIDPANLAAEPSQLFSTEGLELSHFVHPGENEQLAEGALAAQIGYSEADSDLQKAISEIDGLQTLGGERRLASFIRDDRSSLWECPAELNNKLTESAKTKSPFPLVRMVLATPGIFSDGWRPGWLKKSGDSWIGTPPGLQSDQLQLKLVAVANDRWQPLSGWSYEKGHPKALRRMTPAGSVFYFEVIDSKLTDWGSLWLQPVSDDLQDCRDGYGLALWGLSEYCQETLS